MDWTPLAAIASAKRSMLPSVSRRPATALNLFPESRTADGFMLRARMHDGQGKSKIKMETPSLQNKLVSCQR